jgi:hypothetical protein
VWHAIVQTANAAGDDWLDYGDVSFETFDQFEADHSVEMIGSLKRCRLGWLNTPDFECSTVAADAMAARDDVLPS